MNTAATIIARLTQYIINPILLIIFSLGFLLFVYGLVIFLMDIGDGKNRQTGINHMLWGIGGMLIMSSVDGIIALIDNTFNFHALSNTPDMTQVQKAATNLFGGFH